PELLQYVRRAADTMGVRPHYQFNTRVLEAQYDEAANIWRLELDDGTQATCTFLISAVGPLSATRMPNIPGVETFRGESFHSSRWPRDENGGPAGVDFTGQRVGVIGNRCRGVQLISIAAQTPSQQRGSPRTPNR